MFLALTAIQLFNFGSESLDLWSCLSLFVNSCQAAVKKQDQRSRDSDPKLNSWIAVKAKNSEIDKLTVVLFNRLTPKKFNNFDTG